MLWHCGKSYCLQCCHPIWAQDGVLAGPLMSQLLANAPGEEADGTMWNIQKLLAPGFSWAQPSPLCPLGEFSRAWKTFLSLFLSLCNCAFQVTKKTLSKIKFTKHSDLRVLIFTDEKNLADHWWLQIQYIIGRYTKVTWWELALEWS